MAETGNSTGPMITPDILSFALSIIALAGMVWKISAEKASLDRKILEVSHKLELVIKTQEAWARQQENLSDQVLLIGNQARELAEHKYARSREDLAAFREDVTPALKELTADMKAIKSFLTKTTDFNG